MRVYRRKRTSDTWHWCKNCTEWPTTDFVEHNGKPTSGELCDQCLGKERAGNCRS
jgi:hypothetical protein